MIFQVSTCRVVTFYSGVLTQYFGTKNLKLRKQFFSIHFPREGKRF